MLRRTVLAALLVLAGAAVFSSAPTLQAAVVRATKTGVVDGRIVDTNGAPIAGVAVAAWNDADRSDLRRTQTDARGRFFFEALAGKRYTVLTSAQGYVSTGSPRVAPDGPPVTVTLQLAGRVRGRLVDAARRPIPDFQIEAQRFQSPTGAFELEVGNDHGVFLVKLPDGGAAFKVIDAELSAERDLGEVVFAPAPPVTIVVVHEDGSRAMMEALTWYRKVNGVPGTPLARDRFRTDHRGWVTVPGTLDEGIYVSTLMHRPAPEAPLVPGTGQVTLTIPDPFKAWQARAAHRAARSEARP